MRMQTSTRPKLTDADSNLGNGFFLLLDPRPYPEMIGGEYCQDPDPLL